MKLTDSISTSLGLRGEYNKYPLLGIELEFERYKDQYPSPTWWSQMDDPSLRNRGVELVSIPTQYEDLPRLLNFASPWIEEVGVAANYRCGVHIHMNMRCFSWGDLWNLSTLYLLLEPNLFAVHAPGRDKNHFCVPNYLDTALIDAMADDIQTLRGNRPPPLRILECPKYAALNYAPLRKQGTIEFRMFPGTTDMRKVQRWADMLISLQQAAVKFDSPQEIIQLYEDIGREELAKRFDLHTCEINDLDSEDSEIAANMICGYEPVTWQDLDWTMTDVVAEWPEDPAAYVDVGVQDIVNNLLNGVRFANNGGE